ncbi:MAG TPA: N-6 DNA methylase [Allosphingosinicella sp.]|nr:N-6 DNA methylase [Allosphingosinicella sp.]
MPEIVNEITFVARLGVATKLRAERRRNQGLTVLIENGEVEERQVDRSGSVRRCDIRLNSRGGAKLASGEMKRPEVPAGRDPRSQELRDDARRKAIARGLPYYFTCNMREVVLYAVSTALDQPDREETSFVLANIRTSADVDAFRSEIEESWSRFLDDLEQRLLAVGQARPSVTTEDVILLRDAINAVAEEALARAERYIQSEPAHREAVREEATAVVGFEPELSATHPGLFRDEVAQLLRFGIFVVAQKLILYRVLAETGPRRRHPFQLDPLAVNQTTTDPRMIHNQLAAAFDQAIDRSEDYETAFLPRPLQDLVFCQPVGIDEVNESQVGRVWHRLLGAVESASWESISRNLVGFLYEVIVDEKFRHELGQFYTREDVVDILTTFAIREHTDLVLDPASGGGSFLRSAYVRKRALGATHEGTLAETWGFEITAFAAELSTITLAASDPSEPAAYPRVLLTDFFDIRPGKLTDLAIPDLDGALRIPRSFDAVIGNPPYISYRRQTNQGTVLNALARLPRSLSLPRFSGKSDAYVWFVAHATQFLRNGGRLSFVVSSAILFSDYGIGLIRFLGMHFRIRAVIDSMVERWFPDADTNAVLLLLEREEKAEERSGSTIKFIRLRRPLSQLIASPGARERRQSIEDFVDELLGGSEGELDPRFVINAVLQGESGGLTFSSSSTELGEDEE